MDQDETPIGELFARLIDQAKDYAKAEAGVARAQAEAKVDALRRPALLLAGALLLLIAAVVTLVMTIANALATIIGPLAGGLVATLVALAAAGGLALWAKRAVAGRP